MRRVAILSCAGILGVSAIIGLLAGEAPAAPPARHIVAFTFAEPKRLQDFTPDQLRHLNESAFTGAGVSYIGGYKCHRGPTLQELQDCIVSLKRSCRKHLWLTLYINSMLGFDPENKDSHTSAQRIAHNTREFLTFRGLDLDNSAGLREAFEANWVEALRIAKALEAPGIMFDCEMYNDNRAYRVTGGPGLAELRGVSQETVTEQVRSLGARLADLTHETYPAAVIWFFFTRLDAENNAVAELTRGMLARCKQADYSLRAIDGGESGLGYLHPNAEHLAQVIRRRWSLSKPFLLAHRNYELSGVHAPFMDPDRKAFWMAPSSVGMLKKIEDMTPLYEELLKSYRYLWIYCAGQSIYPYGPDSARFSQVLRTAMARVSYAPPDLEGVPDEPPPAPVAPKVTSESLLQQSVAETRGVTRVVDFSRPESTGIGLAPAETWPGANGAVLVLLPDAARTRYLVELRLGAWDRRPEGQWPGVLAAKLPITDWTPYAGIGIDVRNVGRHRGEIGMQVNDADGTNWWSYYEFLPGEECTLSVRVKEMSRRRKVDASKIASVLFMTRRPETDLQFQLGPLVLVPQAE